MRTPWRRRLTMAAIAIAVAAIVSGPYFVNCWRVYGDPLYTFNVHGGIYSQAEGNGKWTESTAGYIGEKVVSRPLEMLDTVAQGLTTYPFGNKWHGLDRWYPRLGDWASIAALVGMVVLAASAPGRLLLIVMVASLVPSSFTWKVDPDFRFTEHVYPLLLIAASVSVGAVLRGARALLVPRRPGDPRTVWAISWVAWATMVGVGLAGLWFVERVSPGWAFVETLRAREDATATAGVRDARFFGGGWSEVIRGGNVTMRVVTDEAALFVPLPTAQDYPVTLRMDPFPDPLVGPQRLPIVEVTLNGAPVSVVALEWTPDRVASYDLVLPRRLVRQGVNELRLRVRRPPTAAGIQPGLTDGDAVGLWYARVHPGAH